MTVRSRGILGAAVSAAVLTAVVVAAFVGASLIGSGEGDPPTLQELLDTTPPPPWISPYPTNDPSLPTQPADDTNRTPDPNATVPPFKIGGVSVPIPAGAQRSAITGDPGGYTSWRIELNSSFVSFDQYGLTDSDIAVAYEDSFDATLDAIWLVAQESAEPSPPTLDVGGVPVSVPPGSYYSILDKPFTPDDPLYVVRLSRSVLSFDSSGVSTKSIQAEDASAFTPTLAALDASVADE